MEEPLIMTNQPDLMTNNEVDNSEEGEGELLSLSELGLSIVTKEEESDERPVVPVSTEATYTEGVEDMVPMNTELIEEDLTIIRADKTEIVGVPITPPPTPPTPPIFTIITTTITTTTITTTTTNALHE